MNEYILTPTRKQDIPEPVSQESYTPADVDQQLAELDRAQRELETAKERIKKVKDDLSRMLANVDVAPSEFEAWIFNLYWNTQGYTPILRSLVKKRLGEAHKLWQALIEGTVDWPCRDCGKIGQRIFSSKTAFVEAKRRNFYRCPQCSEKYKQEQERRAQAHRVRREQQEHRFDELRAMPYQEYLQTPEWEETRKRALKRAGYACQTCNAQKVSLHVHHRTYERIGEELARDLTVLCADCHAKFHNKEPQ